MDHMTVIVVPGFVPLRCLLPLDHQAIARHGRIVAVGIAGKDYALAASLLTRARADNPGVLPVLRASALEIVDGVIPEDRNSALTHDRAGVVLGIDKMNRNTRFRLTGLEHRLEHTISVHPTPTEFRQECRMSVENSPLESSEYEGPK